MTTSDDAYSGKKSLMIQRPVGPAYGEIGPNVLQSIDATPFLNKKIQLKAAVKAKTDSSTFSFLHLLIEADTQGETYNGDPPLFDSLDKFRIEGNEWQEIVIEAYVPENAHTITYSTHLRDFGTVWIDAIQIEIIE